MTDSDESTPVPESEWAAPDIVPMEGETYYQAYERMLKEEAGITEETEPLGVLTGQVPVRSMPIALGAPEGIKGENLPKTKLDGEVDESSE